MEIQHYICEQWAEVFVLPQIKVSVRKNEDGGDEEEGSSAAVICEECGRGDRRHRLLVCILCDSGYDFTCFDCRDSTL